MRKEIKFILHKRECTNFSEPQSGDENSKFILKRRSICLFTEAHFQLMPDSITVVLYIF